MNTPEKDPRNKPGNKDQGYQNPADETRRREGGDDALAESSPTDTRSDEKVIVNTQREDKIVNTPSQSVAHPSELEGSDEEVL